jgi:hypothetical protein
LEIAKMTLGFLREGKLLLDTFCLHLISIVADKPGGKFGAPTLSIEPIH